MGCLLKQGGGLYPRLRVGAVLLAAGAGRRMGGVAKPLIRLQGVPLIRRHLVALSGAGVDEVVVVTGHARDAVEEQVRSFSVLLAFVAFQDLLRNGSRLATFDRFACPRAERRQGRSVIKPPQRLPGRQPGPACRAPDCPRARPGTIPPSPLARADEMIQ